jgi:hypothetical protein
MRVTMPVLVMKRFEVLRAFLFWTLKAHIHGKPRVPRYEHQLVRAGRSSVGLLVTIVCLHQDTNEGNLPKYSTPDMRLERASRILWALPLRDGASPLPVSDAHVVRDHRSNFPIKLLKSFPEM